MKGKNIPANFDPSKSPFAGWGVFLRFHRNGACQYLDSPEAADVDLAVVHQRKRIESAKESVPSFSYTAWVVQRRDRWGEEGGTPAAPRRLWSHQGGWIPSTRTLLLQGASSVVWCQGMKSFEVMCVYEGT